MAGGGGLQAQIAGDVKALGQSASESMGGQPKKDDQGTGLGGARKQGMESAKILGSKKRGGKIKKTGKYRLHKGERVLTKKQAKGYKK